MTTGLVPGPGTTACPRCGAAVADDQEWCLTCGDAARTRLVPTPNWRTPLAALALVGALAVIALAIAFVTLTGDDAPPPAATTPAPTAAPAPAPATAPPPAPATTQPSATTTRPEPTTTTQP